jgi:phage shock protein C
MKTKQEINLMQKQKNGSQKRLTKSSTNKSIWGVAGGLAEFLDVDVTLVRLAFVLLTLAGGPGLLLYIALGIVMPSESAQHNLV